MQVVIATQFLENYGAHDWSGRGECPQRWKAKGGDTYFVNASASDIADSNWFDAVEECIAHSSDYSQEYIISSQIVDTIDFVESDHIAFWESAVYASFDGEKLHCEKKVFGMMDNQIVGIRRWLQDENGSSEMTLTMLEEPVIEQWREDAEIGEVA